CSVVNNNIYVDRYLKYFYDIGLKAPNVDTNLLLNQVDFMTASNFGNIYVFITPKIGTISSGSTPIFITQSQKQLIINELDKIKMASHQIVPMDPIYKTYDLGVSIPGEYPSTSIKDETNLVVVMHKTSKQNKQKIKQDVYNIFVDYFSTISTSIGQVVSLTDISNSILNINGIKTFYTSRIANNIEYKANGLSFLQWNPIYPVQDIQVTAQNMQLESFEYPFLNQPEEFFSKIIVTDE
ncbi:MAG: hypothetical protein EBU90_28080, partial [Proteobacteria bacterium]|nr:hypothetical protein [Pseudomonadota bacterium]